MTKPEVRKLDRIFSLKMREKHPCCELCARGGKMDPHHIISRRYRLLRWCPDNIVVVCFGCHRRLHDNPFWSVAVLTELRGWEVLDALNRLSRLTGVKRTYEEAVEQMWWTVEQYAERYLGEVCDEC
jgi:predicted Fe-S protein YdhL (DUF1289 family)